MERLEWKCRGIVERVNPKVPLTTTGYQTRSRDISVLDSF